MTKEEWQTVGIPLAQVDETTVLYLESGLEWLLYNTTLEFEQNNVEQIAALPSSVKLFLLQFIELSEKNSQVISESINGLSQSFSTKSKQVLIKELANELLKPILKSNVKFYPCKSRWRN